MSNHVTEWLNAYLDDELNTSQLQRVEAHLAECQVCAAELESLATLSNVLHEVHAPEFTPSERFAAQVNLRLSHQRKTSTNKIFEIGWWMIPVGLLATWIFLNTSFLVNDILSAANSFGLLTNVPSWMMFGASNTADWSAILGRFGILSGNSLDWAVSTEAFTRTTLPQITLQVSIALLYLSWMAIWWARYRRQGYGQLLEG